MPPLNSEVQSQPPHGSERNELPVVIKPYAFHGVRLHVRAGNDEVIGDCPFCGKRDKFYISLENERWQCKYCRVGTEEGQGGNVYTFLRILWDRSNDVTADYSELMQDRGFLSSETLSAWGIVRSILNDEWLVPAWGANGKLSQLYRYCHDYKAGKRKLWCTTGLNHQIFGYNNYDPEKPDVYICEGWKGPILWEVMRSTKLDEYGQYVYTADESESLLTRANVIALAGCNSFPEVWAGLFPGKNVCLMFDNDHPREHAGKRIDPAAYTGARRITKILSASQQAPDSVHYLKWGETDHNPDLSSGYSVRDALIQTDDAELRSAILGELLAKVSPVPDEWVATAADKEKKGRKQGGDELRIIPCSDWETLENACVKAMKWTEGLDRAFSIMLSCVLSTELGGSQLWIKVMSPPSGGKTTLCEALSINQQYVYALSTLRGFHSGYKQSGGEDEDNSLLSLIYGKTLIIKDGDTLLSSENLEQILAEARDIYDRKSRSHYRNKMGKVYTGINLTWILCGTSSLRQLDTSELGQRFLDVVIMEGVDDELEDEILLRVGYRADRESSSICNGKADTQQSPEMTRMMQLAGGYVQYLRENAERLAGEISIPDPIIRRCCDLAKFVSYMRARPSKKQEEVNEREIGARLMEQMIRLTKCLTIVLNKETPDEEVLRRVTRTALDTARGRMLKLVDYIYMHGNEGAQIKALETLTARTTAKLRDDMVFLKELEVLEVYRPTSRYGISSTPKWRLTPKFQKVYESVTGKSIAPEIDEPEDIFE